MDDDMIYINTVRYHRLYYKWNVDFLARYNKNDEGMLNEEK